MVGEDCLQIEIVGHHPVYSSWLSPDKLSFQDKSFFLILKAMIFILKVLNKLFVLRTFMLRCDRKIKGV